MEQVIHSENAERRRKSFILAVIITVIAIYAAVPTYGIIRDISTGGHVFVLESDLPGVRLQRPVLGFIGKLYHFFSAQEEVAVPVEQRIDLKGRVLYTDGTPFVHGLIEFRSDPRYTRTDSQGYFLFVDVDEGSHTISVLDEAGNVLASCKVEIERAAGIENAELVRLPDGTYVFQVAVHVQVLEIVIHLQKGEDGRVTGIDRIDLGAAPAGTPQPAGPTALEDPVNPPVRPDVPVPAGGGGGSGGGSGGDAGDSGMDSGEAAPAPFDFDVLDAATTASYGRAGAARVNIFGQNKRIAPGMSGSYKFTVDNTGNRYATLYDVTFAAVDTLPAAHKIPLRFRLKADGVYVAGNETAWCAPEELYQDTAVAGGRNVKYTLEWNWPDGEDDNAYAAYAGNPAYSYSLTIKVTAQAG